MIDFPQTTVKQEQESDSEVLQEIAEDLLELRLLIHALEKGQKELTDRIGQLESMVRSTGKAQVQELRQVRTDLLGDRKMLVAVNIFNGIVQTLESLQLMEDTLEMDGDRDVYNQVHAASQMLKMMLRGMGIVPYQAEAGDSFDPNKMECLELVDGEPGRVIKTLRVGYRISDEILSHVGVVVGRSAISQKS